MKKLLTLLAVIFLANTFYAKGVVVKYADELSPAQRKSMSEAWSETGMAYLDAGDKKNAKASLQYAVEWYPMGAVAQKSRVQLKKHFSVSLVYNMNTEFSKFVERGDILSVTKHKLNNYLMALEAKKDADVMYKVATLYYEMGKTEKAADYLNKAIAAGYSPEKVDTSLKSLIKAGM